MILKNFNFSIKIIKQNKETQVKFLSQIFLIKILKKQTLNQL